MPFRPEPWADGKEMTPSRRTRKVLHRGFRTVDSARGRLGTAWLDIGLGGKGLCASCRRRFSGLLGCSSSPPGRGRS